MKLKPIDKLTVLSALVASLIAPLANADAFSAPDDSFIPLQAPVDIVTTRNKNYSSDYTNDSGIENYSSKCKVDFSDWDAMNIIPDYAKYTFAVAPFWIQGCNYNQWAYIKPSKYNHYHLSYEDADMMDCQIQNTCPEHDPRDQPRTLSAHGHSEKLKLSFYNGSGYLPFGIKTIRIPGNKPVKLCFKKRNESGAPWVTNEDRIGSIPGRWSCWNRLGTGHWDLSNWVNNVVMVTITGASQSGTFSVDDIVYRLY